MADTVIDAVKKQLIMLADEPYRIFTAKLLPKDTSLIGVRLPQVRAVAKKLAADSKGTGVYLDAVQQTTVLTLEEKLCWGFVIGYSNLPISEKLVRLQSFVPIIDNWSVCDSTCSSLKFTSRYQAEMWAFLQPYFHSQREYEIRFAIVMGLDYFIDDVYIKSFFTAITQSRRDAYYVQMGAAWAISVAFVKFPAVTLEYLRTGVLDDVTYKKAIQKICESKRTTPQQKWIVRTLQQS